MNLNSKLLITSGLVLGVGACSSSLDVGGVRKLTDITTAEELARNFADSDGNGTIEDVGGALAAGKTLSARRVGVSGWTLNYDTDETSLATGGSATAKSNSDGALTVSINGTQQRFKPSDATEDGYGYQINSGSVGYFGVFSYTGQIAELLAPGNGYSEVLEIQRDTEDPSNPGQHEAVFAVLGTETRDADLMALPTATYDGRTRMNILPNSGFRSWGEDVVKVRSNLTMTADFGAGEISGTASDFTQQDPGAAEVSVSGSVAMDKTTFDNNGFAGTLTPDATFSSNMDMDSFSGTYSGAFYGPDANEVTGVLSMTSSSSDGNYNGIGLFTADKR